MANSRPAGAMGGRGPMGGGHGPMRGTVVKAKDFKGSIKKLLRYLKPYALQLIVVVIFAIASTVFMILGPSILGNITTLIYEGLMNIIGGTGMGIDFDAILKIICLLIGLYLASALFTFIQSWIMSGVIMKLGYSLRKDIEDKMHKLPLNYYDTRNYGEILSHITNDVDTLVNSLNQSITQVITSVTNVVGMLIMMLLISWKMSVIAILVLPLSLILVLFVVKHTQKYFRRQQEYLGHVNGHIEEMYGSHLIVKAFNGEADSVAQFNDLNNQLYDAGWKAQFSSSLMMPIMNFINNIAYVIVCIMGGYYASIGVITVGNIQSFIQYMKQSTQQVQQVANISNVLQQTAAAAERVFEYLEEAAEEPDTEYPVPVDDIKGEVIFAHVHFGYNPDQIIINDFTAKVEPGQKVAIVGPTGAGKTTMIKLLMRFYDVTQGAICIDGLDLKQFRRNDLRSLFGMVLQDTWLYNASIKDNIRYGKQNASDEEVIEAAKAAQVDHFVRTLPDGYDMVLNEEASNISQGQKQLLTIARAILCDPKILILDEATSSVDTRTEILIQKAMDNLMRGRTSFIIAHRLSTIKDSDMILCMDHGDIVEKGTHEELLAKGGFYANLYNSQFSDGEEEE